MQVLGSRRSTWRTRSGPSTRSPASSSSASRRYRTGEGRLCLRASETGGVSAHSSLSPWPELRGTRAVGRRTSGASCRLSSSAARTSAKSEAGSRRERSGERMGAYFVRQRKVVPPEVLAQGRWSGLVDGEAPVEVNVRGVAGSRRVGGGVDRQLGRGHSMKRLAGVEGPLRRAILVTAFVLGVTTAARAEESLSELQVKAQRGDAVAQFNLGE